MYSSSDHHAELESEYVQNGKVVLSAKRAESMNTGKQT